MSEGFVVVVYDVVKDRRRARLHRRLTAVLEHVQKSVFEGPVSARDLAAIRTAIREEVDLEADTVRLYHLCARCRGATELYGTSPVVPEQPEDIVLD